MNGPLLISLLPSESFGVAADATPGLVSSVVAVLLLVGILLILPMRRSGTA
jgi:hypothetical protein